VVVAIILVLVALAAGALSQFVAAQVDGATAVTLRKVMTVLDEHVKLVLEQANKENLTDKPEVMKWAGFDHKKARTLYQLARLRQEFPTKFDHVDANLYQPAVLPLPPTVPPRARFPLLLPPKSVFRLGNKVKLGTSRSALLLLTLQQGRGGQNWDAETTLGRGTLQDLDGDGLREILDASGVPLELLVTFRYFNQAENRTIEAELPDAFYDPSVCDGIYTSANPKVTPQLMLETLSVYVISVGRDKRYVLYPPNAEYNEADLFNADNLSGRALRTQGARGDQ
jgi:hypothetical protein